jgi:hypothetical protein
MELGARVEAVLGDHGPDLDRLKKDVEAGIAVHCCSIKQAGRSQGIAFDACCQQSSTTDYSVLRCEDFPARVRGAEVAASAVVQVCIISNTRQFIFRDKRQAVCYYLHARILTVTCNFLS